MYIDNQVNIERPYRKRLILLLAIHPCEQSASTVFLILEKVVIITRQIIFRVKIVKKNYPLW